MKSISKTKFITSAFLLFICLFSLDVLAQQGGFNMGTATSQIQSSANTVKTWANYIIGATFFIGCIFSTWALMTGNPQAKNYVIGTIVALVFWGIITAIVN